MSEHPDHVAFLKNVELFSGVSGPMLAKISQRARRVEHQAGQVIVRAGARAHAFHVIIDGTAEVLKDDDHVADLGPGEYFGEIAAAGDSVRSATVRARTDVIALAIDTVSFQQLIEGEPELAAALPPVIAERLAQLRKQ